MNDIYLDLPDDFHLTLSSMAILELFSGKSTRNIKVEKKIEELISKFEIKDIDRKVSKRAGILMRDNKITIGLADYILAATAMEIGAQVVTLNKKHFQKIPGLSIYSP